VRPVRRSLLQTLENLLHARFPVGSEPNEASLRKGDINAADRAFVAEQRRGIGDLLWQRPQMVTFPDGPGAAGVKIVVDVLYARRRSSPDERCRFHVIFPTKNELGPNLADTVRHGRCAIGGDVFPHRFVVVHFLNGDIGLGGRGIDPENQSTLSRLSASVTASENLTAFV
jgi:hypothetical protein